MPDDEPDDDEPKADAAEESEDSEDPWVGTGDVDATDDETDEESE